MSRPILIVSPLVAAADPDGALVADPPEGDAPALHAASTTAAARPIATDPGADRLNIGCLPFLPVPHFAVLTWTRCV